jgi:hypothetical protein
MSLVIRHPDEWIGIPEYWPYPRPDGRELAGPEVWAAELLDEFIEHGMPEEQRPLVAEVLAMAVQRSIDNRSRLYLLLETWEGPAYLVEAVTHDRRELGMRDLEDFLGREDETQLGAPFAEPFTTASGLEGARCFRYLPYSDHGVIYGRADYGFIDADTLLTLTGMELDLVHFERLKVHLGVLAATVSAVD